MIELDASIKILICSEPVDMRKSIDGLVMLIVEQLDNNPQDKTLFIFYNKGQDKFKGIVWDGDGFILLYKRREKGRFKFPKNIESSTYEIDADLFKWLRKGFDFYALKSAPELKISNYF